MKTAPNCTLPDSSDQSSVATPVNRPIEPKDASLGGRSPAMFKEHFEKSERFLLSLVTQMWLSQKVKSPPL